MGALPGSYQVTLVILGRRRATLHIRWSACGSDSHALSQPAAAAPKLNRIGHDTGPWEQTYTGVSLLEVFAQDGAPLVDVAHQPTLSFDIAEQIRFDHRGARERRQGLPAMTTPGQSTPANAPKAVEDGLAHRIRRLSPQSVGNEGLWRSRRSVR